MSKGDWSITRLLWVRLVWGVVVWTTFGGVSFAQSAAGDAPGYVEGIAQSAFGSATSQSYGGEVGYRITPGLQLFVEGGRVAETAGVDLATSAQLIAGVLAQQQSGVAYSAKQPVTFVLVGVRHPFAPAGLFHPYVAAGVGMAQVTKDVAFTVAGTDVTDTIQQFGVALGTDLKGSRTSPMISVGAGASLPVGRVLLVDFQYRYRRVFAADRGLNINRVGLGVGVRF